jgi:hypothetical protein
MHEEERGKGLVTVSSLPTKEDFIEWKAAACRAVLRPNEVTFLRLAGFLLVLSGFVLRVFLAVNFYCKAVYMLLVVLGMVIGFYYDSLQPYLVRRRAAAYYDSHLERMLAQAVIFRESTVSISTDRYHAELPYSMLYGAYEDGKVFLLYTGLDEIWAVPKRAMTRDDCRKVRELLARRLNEKYKQEGVR